MNIIIFDTETTSLRLPNVAPQEKQPRIIEFGAIRIDTETAEADRLLTGNSFHALLNQLLNPGFPISAEITKITGITNEDLAGKPTFAEWLPVLVAFFTGADALIAHNAPFDFGMLKNELELVGLGGLNDFPWPFSIICTAQEYTPVIGHIPSMKVLYEHVMGEPLEQTHRAIDDVMALYKIIVKDNFFAKVGLV